jgi:hypothetical protein
MTLPFTLPDWLPWWVPIILLVPALLYALAFLFMPFSVIGVKGRLDVMEARLDELQGEIRRLALRMPEAVRGADFDEVYAPPPSDASSPHSSPMVPQRPPIPPAAHELDDEPPQGFGPRGQRGQASRGTGRPNRAEPRLDWPR